MHEKFPGSGRANAAPKEMSRDEQVAKVFQILDQYTRKNGKQLSPEGIRAAAEIFVERAEERGEPIDFSALPLQAMIEAREDVAETKMPIVNGSTGEVIGSAETMMDARQGVQKYNEEQRGVN
ncbi:MAG TPA: hypothetical protein VF829_02600 [Candidatus Paceibacterota bacterium]